MNDCEWTLDIKSDFWKTSCGKKLNFNNLEKGPIEHGMKFCPFCGKEIAQIEDYTHN